MQFGNLKGPRFVNVDTTISKQFSILPEGRLKFELRGEAYNLTNRFPMADPDLGGPTSANFGRVVAQRAGVFGRQIQFSGRLVW